VELDRAFPTAVDVALGGLILVIWENGKAVVADPPKDHPCDKPTP
jgi:hypothetical protein